MKRICTKCKKQYESGHYYDSCPHSARGFTGSNLSEDSGTMNFYLHGLSDSDSSSSSSNDDSFSGGGGDFGGGGSSGDW